MKCLDRFNKKMQLSGGSLRNEKIFNSKNLLKATFEDDASIALGIYMWELNKKIYNIDTSIKIRLYGRMFSQVNGETVKFQTLIDTEINTGDIIYDSINERYYLCTESFNIDNIHYKGKLTLCNIMLKWQDKTNGKIFEYPCYEINSTQYNSGEKEGNVLNYGNSQHQLYLPMDENTVEINTPQRFFIDNATKHKTSFVVTQNDTTSLGFGKKGLVRITIKECPTDSEKDRPDLGICDYIDFSSSNTDIDNDNNVVVYKSEIEYKTNIIKSGGNYQKFTAKFYDDYNNELQINPCWDIICDFKDKLDIRYSDNNILIGIDNDDYIDEEFKLAVKDENNKYYSSIIVRIESLL